MVNKKWPQIQEKFRLDYNLTSVSYNTWIEPLEVGSVAKDGILEIIFTGENSSFALDHLTKRFSVLMKVTIEEVTGQSVDIRFVPEPKKPSQSLYKNNKESDSVYPLTERSGIKKEYTFDNFILGSSNDEAHAAALAVAENPGKVFNPLFIYSNPGLGKTHLMHAIANFILDKDKTAKVRYVTSETFMNDYIDACLKKNRPAMVEFQKKYRDVDILLIDDIQYIFGRGEDTLVEFFNTFNDLYVKGHQIVISSDKPPKDFATLEDRFKSRFMQGLIQEIKAPVYETRMAILNRKVQDSGCKFNDEVLQYIAKNVKSDIRKLEGALGKIVSTQHLHNSELEPVSLDTAKDLLKDFIDEESQRTPTPDDIIKAVAEYYKIRPEDIKSKKRTKEIATPRHVAMYLIRVMTDYTLKDVGDIIGSRDHTTIKYGFEKIMTEMNEREDFKKTIETLKKKILG
ncbi:MAG: chromosomal replication initiator protein DnaA [Lachnospiraceae bacterium]|nr:chromosomal replication initiator protein DnaA [Lachnospiraceae bacterium]MBQ7601492.1 chromosomal replication initiator protein DnaA [Lachnospiraceae bacterium]MBR6977107.1 chromosomal replication initiator protein DnaA [Lachnospiraceae bacterium]